MKKEKRIQLFLLSGFLGSGKTTLLLKFLEELEGEKVGVIINEFGKIGCDGEIIRRSGLEMVELSNGQIFCSCMEGDFIKAAAEFANLNVEYLLVEASGLALPRTFKTTLETIQKLSGNAFDHRGIVCVTDTKQFFELIDVVSGFEEQIEYSDVVLINKIDLGDKKVVNTIEIEVRKRNREAKIMRTLYCDAVAGILKNSEDFKTIEPKPIGPKIILQPAGLESKPMNGRRIKKHLLVPGEIVLKASLVKFLENVVPYAYRIKGFVQAKENLLFVDITKGEDISVQETDINIEKQKHGINIISIYGEDIEEKIKEVWKQATSIPCFLT